MSYKLSIIIPIYKVEPYLHKCINSILAQTFADFELILVDDGSPDKCGEICDEYAKRDTRIKVIHKENGGVSAARNAGLEIAQGEYIGFVDSDDYIEKDMYEILYKLSKEYDADIVECGFSIVKEDEVKPILTNTNIITGDKLLALHLLAKHWAHCLSWNKIYKKYLFDGIKFPCGMIHEEEVIMHRLFFSLNKYVYIGESKYFYVQREGSIMDESYSLKRLNRLEAYKDRFYFLKNNIKEESIIRLVEHKYFMCIIDNYNSLNSNSKLDIHKIHRKKLKKCIVENYSGFLKNNLLVEYKHLIMLSRLNQFLFDLLYNIHSNFSKWYYNIRYKCAIFINAKMKKTL